MVTVSGRRMALILLLVVSGFLGGSGAGSAQELVFVADPWCPYNCEPESEAPGIIVEMLEFAFGPHGYQVVYRVVPWARAIEDSRHGVYAGIIGAGHLEAPDFVFHQIPAFTAIDEFYIREDSGWVYEGLESLAEVRLGVIKDYSYGTLFQDYIQVHQDDPDRIFMAAGEAPLPRIIRMLAAGRVDVIVEDRGVMHEQLSRMPDMPPLTGAALVAKEDMFVAFSPADSLSPRYAELFDAGLQAMAESGRLAELARKYGLAEEQVGALTSQSSKGSH
jgi:polar amino acid transport system substrate-binding protein